MARASRLRRIHRGVYAVGHRHLTRRGWWMAAVLSGGPGAVLSHRPAGAAWDIRAWSGRQAITVPAWRRSTASIDFHCSVLPADETTELDGIPITTMPRTLLDLATILDRDQLLNAINEAEQQGLTDVLSLPDLVERHRGERGAGRLRADLDDAGLGRGVSDRELEELFVRFLVKRGLPRPDLNAWVAVDDRSYKADCMWRSRRVVVELHSVLYHGTPVATTRDAGRDRRLLLAGWRVIHVTWAQLVSPVEADALERDLRAVLRA